MTVERLSRPRISRKLGDAGAAPSPGPAPKADRPKAPFVDEGAPISVWHFMAVGALLTLMIVLTGFLFAIGQTLWGLAAVALFHIPIID